MRSARALVGAMREYRAVFLVNGVLLLILGVAMLVPALLDAWVGHSDWQVFLAAAFLKHFCVDGRSENTPKM